MLTFFTFLSGTMLGTPVWAWLLFLSVVLTLLFLDLGLLHRRQREIGVRESLLLSAFYIAVACIFGLWVWWSIGATAGMEFFTGYLVEKSLSLDNVFVISLVFASFAIPRQYQHRVLFWGILGVILLRGIMIGLGTALVHEFHWVLWLFGGFLILTGIKMLFTDETPDDPSQSRLVRALRRVVPVTDSLHGNRFFIRQTTEQGASKLYVTPLFLALIVVEISDLIFAVDSIPAVFAITTDPFIVYTSNIFAILGLRALYFALAAIVARFEYLRYALAAVLVFVGGKIFWAQVFGKVDPLLSLGVTAGLLALGIIVSLIKTRETVAAERQ
ncbi:TerC family protein [Telmatospirillum sp. J64-1]|uniref:TerC family protein n=1 Tax=Telmatospirillum sp. J64-1 TaxID=2502183 RepID=UPI00115F48DA|nr:TerC family protein [Telmatospirillum sp. J64-1]